MKVEFAPGHCRNLRFSSDPIHGQRLKNHVIRTIDVINEDICQLKCYQEPNCVSYNFKKIANTDGKHKCDLNNATYEHHNKHSGDLGQNESYVYRGAENACAKKPCKNNATCQAGFTDRDYQCLCMNGFTGHDCEMDVDECKGTHSCDENASCQNNLGFYKCKCKDGFSGDGINCTDVDECKGTHSCDENASCQNILGSFKCKCNDGFSGDGINCTASSLPYQNIGCFTDNLTSPAIETLEGQDSILDGNYTTRNDSITKCYRAAKKRGFHIFAVRDGGWCASSASAPNTFDKYDKSSDCESDGTGGPFANQVYYIIGHAVVGCYKDNESRAIRGLDGEDYILEEEYKKRENPIAKCAVAAIRAGYSMLAVQYSGQCFASATAPQTFDMYGKSTECGADGEGGAWASQVYTIKALGCQEALGMESGAISNGTISASSELSNFSANQGRLHHSKAWIPRMVDSHSWLQVDLSIVHRVTRVATQGIDYHFLNDDRDFYHYWVTKYKLQYWNDTEISQYYKESGQNANKNFTGNTDPATVVYHDLNPPITARYIRFEPVASNGSISMRVELYGCLQECQNALGMENGAIPDAQITASSEYESEDEDNVNVSMAIYGRLHFQENGSIAGAWVANTSDDNQWLQIDLGAQYAKVTGLATQGRNSSTYPQWVTKYKLQYGDDGETFQFYREHGRTTDKEFTGNTDKDTVVYHKLNPFITTRYIRFVPVAWNGNISMRVELYGCKQDIDECTNGTHSCDINAVCSNTRGSYNCKCKDGFRGEGINCTDIDECTNGTHSCDVNAVCNNTRGSYNCTCKEGFHGDGKTCKGFNATFTNLGSSGRNGPASDCSRYKGQDHEGQVTLSNGIQQWTVPYTGQYSIEAVGAAGGYSEKQSDIQYGGRGARMAGTFNLLKDELIQILVGQEGGVGNDTQISGGGGGTFVVRGSNTSLIVAGGGGGLRAVTSRHQGCDASTNTSGNPGYNSWSGGSNGGGGTAGDGGPSGGGGGGGGGGGFYSSGKNGMTGGEGGKGFLQGGVGGESNLRGGYGGFGGGGGGGAGEGAGGGGGYSGGSGGSNKDDPCGGGGGSYNFGNDQENDCCYNTAGHGHVIITLL